MQENLGGHSQQSQEETEALSLIVQNERNADIYAREGGGRLLGPENFAQYIQFPHGYPHTIVEIGVARGGTTAMSQVLACSPSFDAFGEDMLRNAIAYRRNRGEEPVTINMPGEDARIILKETYGPATESMVSHYPIRALRIAALRSGISEDEFTRKTQVLAVTRDPLAIYNGWLKYWTIARGASTIEEAYEEFGKLSLINLSEAYSCLAETVEEANNQGLQTTVVTTGVFKNPAQRIQGVFRAICEKLGIEYTDDMILFRDPEKDRKIDIYPVTVDAKYVGLHEDIDNKGFRYFPPSYRYTAEVLPALREAGLVQQYQVLHQLSEADFGKIEVPDYII